MTYVISIINVCNIFHMLFLSPSIHTRPVYKGWSGDMKEVVEMICKCVSCLGQLGKCELDFCQCVTCPNKNICSL